MNRKIAANLAAAAILILLIAVGVVCLFSGKEEDVREVSLEKFIEGHKLVGAVPSDAAIVLCAKNFGRICSYLENPVADQLFSGKLRRLATVAYSGKIMRSPAIISSHYSKSLQPLLVVEAPDAAADSTEDFRKLLAAADSSGLFLRTSGDKILISPSETIIGASVRHLEEGRSVLEAEGFSDIAGKVTADDVLFISSTYAGPVLAACFARKHLKNSSFVREMCSWSAFSITGRSGKRITLEGQFQHSAEPGFYLNVLKSGEDGEVRVAEVLPSNTAFAVSLPVGDIGTYIKSHKSYLDGKNRVGRYKESLRIQKGSGKPDAEEWARELDVREVALAQTSDGDDLRKTVLIRTGKKRPKTAGAEDYEYAGYTGLLFGDLFSCAEETSFATFGNWMVVGDRTAVEAYSQPGFLHETLKERLASNGLSQRLPQKGCRLYAFHSLGETSGLIDETFSPAMAAACKEVAAGSSFAPLTASASLRYGEICVDVNGDLGEIVRSKAPIAEKDTTVEIPQGPFKVRNSATGETCTLYQNSHLSVCFQDGNGKDLWGVPFKQKICGYVQEVDFFSNGKIQYLFAAGSRLYIIDRLGRFVNGFPADLGKEVLLGPELTDIDGSGKQKILILHKDNTVGMYDLQGKKVSAWKGITADETIKKLPELLEVQGSKYWTVRTSIQTLVYPFEGGEPLVKGSGDKMIRPESQLSINEKGQVCAKCYDGKDRAFKLERL